MNRATWLRRARHTGGPALLLFAGLWTLAPLQARARQADMQMPQSPQSGMPGMSQPGVPHDPNRLPDAMDRPYTPDPAHVERMREDERRKRLLADTARLVELSTQLKSDVEKTPRDQLSLDVVRRAAEIERLAHDVKEHMKS